jgi:regulator of nucleoside diphosphate kinase
MHRPEPQNVFAPSVPLRIRARDAEVLGSLVQAAGGRDAAIAELLDEELARATIVDDDALPSDVVGLGSRVVYEDGARGERREVELVLPSQAEAARGRISVLSPVGCALLGLAAGATIDWPMPGGRMGHLRVIEVRRGGDGAGAQEVSIKARSGNRAGAEAVPIA